MRYDKFIGKVYALRIMPNRTVLLEHDQAKFFYTIYYLVFKITFRPIFFIFISFDRRNEPDILKFTTMV